MNRRNFISFAGLAVAGFAANPSAVLWSPLGPSCLMDAYRALNAHYNPKGWWQPNPVLTDGGLLVPPGTIDISERVFSAKLTCDTRLFNEKMDEAARAMRRYIMRDIARAEERAFREGLLRGFDATA